MIIYDVKTIPITLTVSTLLYIMKESGVLFYDSRYNGNIPCVIEGKEKVKFVDINTPEGKNLYKEIRDKLNE